MRHKHHSLTTAIALSNAFSAFLPTLSCMHDLLAVFKPDSISQTCGFVQDWDVHQVWFDWKNADDSVGLGLFQFHCLTNLCSSGLKWKVRARCFCSSCFAMKTLGNLKDILQPGRRCQKLKTIVNYETWRNGHGDMYKQL